MDIKSLGTTDTPIRKFIDENLQSAVEETLNQLREDEKVAVFAFANGSEVNMGVAYKPTDSWTIIGVLNKPYKGEFGGGIKIVYKGDK